ncbi:hypothetical protein P691DRAFT_805539 [Macrolepiota fuliginosa MF-IS2]|uniref:Uncharacterized protein n=1 Tax=Macrolepiota fuliginosa MF-IS2 TaxID=1400762 RepID=A0A9P6BZL5_9AGAR|nr:hypothetical protein P691DRAFT_805539 [Macrolepiota fuliginosa MF-IS2]
MVEFISKAAGKRLFEQHLEQYAPPDPLYEIYTNDRGKQKRRQRELPPGLSKRDARILRSVKRRAHYLDKGFSFCGFRCGWTFFIGLVPVAGDVANLSLNHLLIVRKAKQADVPAWLLGKMQINNVISTGVGLVPVAGDVVVAVFKANSRNSALLEEFLRIRGEEYLKLNTGPSGQPLNSAERQEKEKKGWAWYKKKGVSRRDAEQVKPGAGMIEGEVVPSNPVGEGGGPNNNRSATVRTAKDENAPGPSKTRSGFFLFGRERKATAPVGHAEEKERVAEKSRA